MDDTLDVFLDCLNAYIQAVYMRFEKDTKYYELRLDRNLFGEWSITRVNGRINSSLGSCRHEHFDSLVSAIERLNTLAKYRVKHRKYRVTRLGCSYNRSMVQ